ncbi:isthmin-like [Asterias rubens]|uniref:isthmin-like n=1 Tax=Asterias rubens TaxID=7604 RepID=UPI0014559CC6|nr:isthmin-like [Asterias rubens]
MARLTTLYGDKPAGFCTILSPNRDIWRYVASWELRVIVCIISLSMFTSHIKALNVPSGKEITTMESPATGSDEKLSRQLKDADGVILKDDEKRTGSSDKPTKEERQHGLQTNSEKDVQGNDKSDILLERRDKKVDELDKKGNLSSSEQDVGDGSLKTWEELWNDEVIPTDLDSPIDVDDYYTYDYFDGDTDEEADTGPSVERSKKDTSSAPQSHPKKLDRLADIVTGANAPMELVNFGTPNPDIEITIEVVNGDDVKQDGVVISMDLRDDAPLSPERGDTDTLEVNNNGGRGKGKGKNDRPTRPTIRTDVEDSVRDEPEWSSFEFAPFLVGIPVPTGDGFEAENEEKQGTWTGWTTCSASCGGGRSERSRSCGFSCTATESRDCNQQSCPRPGKSEVPTEIVTEEPPQLTALNEEYLDMVLTPENFDVDSCEEWMGCRSETLLSYLARLQDLPNCPCSYPTNIRQNNAIWDLQKRQMFHWKDASGDEAKLPVYKPTAEYCIISTLSPPSTSLASQQCCYDDNQKLITRGPGAGTPQLISAEISPELHYKIDVMPWIICKGDWTKYNKVRHPNNMWECKENPIQADFYQLFQEAKNY